MEKITTHLKKDLKLGNPNETNYWIDLTAKLVGKPYPQIAGLTKKWSREKIKETYLKAMSWKEGSPEKLWWVLYKKEKLPSK